MRSIALLVTCLVACDPEPPPDECIPLLDYQSPLTVTEGSSITFDLTLRPSSPCEAGGHFYFYAQTDASISGGLTADPAGFHLTRAAPTATFTLYAGTDPDTLNETFTMDMYIPGAIANESPEAGVMVIDSTPAP